MEWNVLQHKIGPTTGATYYAGGQLPEQDQECEIVHKYMGLDAPPIRAVFFKGGPWDTGWTTEDDSFFSIAEVNKWRLYEEKE